MLSFDFEQIRKEIRASSADSSIYIGSDSKVYIRDDRKMVAYVTVIILHNRGAKIFRSYRIEPFYGQMRVRLMGEVADAITAAQEIVDVIEDRGFEIHLDVNTSPKYKSSSIVKEAVGYVMGTFGFEPKLKPDAFAASSVADRFCVKYAKKQRRA